MIKKILRIRPEIFLFFLLLSAVALGNGLSDAVYSNYFKEVYQVTAFQRGLIEFPRELPGLLCALVIGILSFLGDLRASFIAQALAFIGVLMLGVLTPPFGVMLIFLFINSMGMHLFMPLQDAIGMSLAEPDQIGRRMGQYFSVRSAFGFVSALIVFFGFRTRLLSFNTPIKWIFIISGFFFACAVVINGLMIRSVKPGKSETYKTKLVFKKQYYGFYILAILHGIQKQVTNVYSTWVIVDLLMKKADTVALLSIVVGFASIFLMNYIGKWMDRFGIRRMMYVDALSFVGIYVIYGLVVWGITSNALPGQGTTVWLVYLLFVLDRLSMQINMVKSVYLRSIAQSDDDVTSTLSMGTSLDHVVSILAAIAGGYVWTNWGSHWVFILGAVFSLGNLYIAYRAKPDKEEDIVKKAGCVSPETAL